MQPNYTSNSFDINVVKLLGFYIKFRNCIAGEIFVN